LKRQFEKTNCFQIQNQSFRPVRYWLSLLLMRLPDILCAIKKRNTLDVSTIFAKLCDVPLRPLRNGLIKWYGRELEKLEKINSDTQETAYICKVLGDLNLSQGRFDEALSFFKKGLRIIEKLDPKDPLVCSFSIAIGTALSATGKSSKEISPWVSKALDVKNRKC
jgi:tetratricopeptide (TPR) repeat protein